jgi:cell pole-organizing protein PopZ
MSDSSGQNEPSMEEILASIRRIISEDSTEKPAPAAPPPAARPAPAAVGAPADPAGDVLVLTEVVADDGSVSRLDSARGEPRRPAPTPPAERRGAVQEAAEAEPARPSPRLRAEPAEAPAMTGVEEAKPSVSSIRAGDPGLLSRKSAAAAATAFAQLSTLPRDTAAAAGGGPTLEAFVRQALEPMLREWLDANLPGIIERLVRDEIERVVRSSSRL